MENLTQTGSDITQRPIIRMNRVLRVLFETDGLEMSVISERCYLMMPSLSRIIQNLEARQLITRRISEKDQRRSIISLAQEGIKLMELIAPKLEARYAHIIETFGYGKWNCFMSYWMS